MNPEAGTQDAERTTLGAWLSYLERLHPKNIELGLDRAAAVLQRLSIDPRFPIITVGGTNGKGSTCAFLEAMLSHAGYRAGLYTSPHLLRYNERVRIARQDVSDADLCRAFEAVERARGDVTLTYFEFGTLAAMWLFARENVGAAILEVGLGGRLDAVNCFDPDCAIVTSIDLDHQDYLGDTREAIGREKAGIFRHGRPAVCADPAPPSSLPGYAREVGAALQRIGHDFGLERETGCWHFHGPAGARRQLPYPALRGVFQLNNAAAALAALEAVAERLPVSDEAVRQALAETVLPGRFQIVPGRPALILDVAHNPHAARALAENLAALPASRGGKTIALFAMLRDKDIGGVAQALAHAVDYWLLAGLDEVRGCDSAHLKQVLRAAGIDKPMEVFPDVARAYRRACEVAGENDRMLAFGSFHTVAETLRQRYTAEG